MKIQVRAIILALMGGCSIQFAQADAPATFVPLEHDTYEAALSAVKQNPDLEIDDNEGWISVRGWVENAKIISIWIFPPKSAAYYPSVGKIEVNVQGDKPVSNIKMLCETTKGICDQFYADLEGIVADF